MGRLGLPGLCILRRMYREGVLGCVLKSRQMSCFG